MKKTKRHLTVFGRRLSTVIEDKGLRVADAVRYLHQFPQFEKLNRVTFYRWLYDKGAGNPRRRERALTFLENIKRHSPEKQFTVSLLKHMEELEKRCSEQRRQIREIVRLCKFNLHPNNQ